ncbi:pentraxin-related protein PTX3 [Brachyhypopomus gauderio]|uniref:pentraxin-related protein PTX3 n=1 Tax=Brachyhypopomus gauderio TaxID=698409 RepID=UPI004041E114
MFGHKILWILLLPCVFRGNELGYNYEHYSDYNEIYNGEQQERATSHPGQLQEPTHWKKLFTMLEDSHKRQNVLLQYTENLLKVEMASLQSELHKLSSANRKSCLNHLEDIQKDQAMNQSREVSNKQQVQHKSKVHQLIEKNNQDTHMARPETTNLQGELSQKAIKSVPAHSSEQGIISWHDEKCERALKDTTTNLQRVYAQLALFQQVAAQSYLPSGCEMALLFPMRSKHTFAEVIPSTSFALTSLSICLWVKVTQCLSKTVLFSYGTKKNPHELQLWLSQHSVIFAITGQTDILESKTKVSDGQWGHYCSIWSSEQGLASLWINGEMVVTSIMMAKGHRLLEGGSVLLGQEKSHTGMYRDLDPLVAFTGKMTAVNMWDHTLEADMIKEYANQNGTCDDLGNVIGWGVSEIIPHGGTQYIN